MNYDDIIYEKKIPLMITSQIKLDSINSSKGLIDQFKRTFIFYSHWHNDHIQGLAFNFHCNSH